MGVKSLWDLLTPLGRPVLLETMEGKALAIDSSIWIYQFQATMRDREGKVLVNAHVLGFLRRICKLLFYGIKPVFVFDGGAPALKRNTIAERKRKKSGAALSHAKVVERLLAAQMRREALNHARAQKSEKSKSLKGKGKALKGKGKAPAGPVVIDENTVYMEDLTGDAPRTPKTPSKKDDTSLPGPSPFSKSKNRWHDHDPYRLPEVNLEKRVAEATRSVVPDPRLATEEELRSFIEEMRPEDFDVTAPAFRELPTEVQYEIVGDLRLKSRQTSYKRLQNMLKKSRTPLDFSKEQIKNLKQRNTLTQQLLITTDTIGQAHVSIPVRIASERNREYVLIKKTDGEGGWILGIRDDGSKENPIQVDQDSATLAKGEPGDSDLDMEEVAIPGQPLHDPDLHEFQRHMALAGIGKRRTPKKNPTPLSTKSQRTKRRAHPLFVPDSDEDMPVSPAADDDDTNMQLALQESLESQEKDDLQHALEASRSEFKGQQLAGVTSTPGSSSGQDVYDGDELNVPGRLETALAIANAGPTPKFSMARRLSSSFPEASMFKTPKLSNDDPLPSLDLSDDASLEYLDEVDEVKQATSPIVNTRTTPNTSHAPLEDIPLSTEVDESSKAKPVEEEFGGLSDSDEDMEPVPVPKPDKKLSAPATPLETPKPKDIDIISNPRRATKVHFDDDNLPIGRTGVETPSPESSAKSPTHEPVLVPEQFEEEYLISDWSRSPSPVADSLFATETPASKATTVEDSWDAAQEMDAHAEEGEFARFLSQVKGKDLDDVRREIDEEIKTLNQQKKAAMRDSEDITQQMIAQIMVMLRLFGIPYITAPMEAEAQCAALVELGLVEGIITDDSDVFLFGGTRVYKNMFNQSKTVECFFLADCARELGIDREKLVQLAYLLGSDYVEGLPGVGPVVAMELLKEFTSLEKFKEWWQRVQSGRDKPEESQSKFRRRFKKRFKTLYIPDDWPNPVVRDAYYNPTVDHSEEAFKWGLPDLDGLRDLLLQEFGWNQSKVEELLLPIIQKMRKRDQAQALNRQGNLNEFFGVNSAGGVIAPRNRKAYASKRLQQVVNDFREQQRKEGKSSKKTNNGTSTEDESSSSSSLGGDEKLPRPVAKRGKGRRGGKGTGSAAAGKGRRGGRGGARGARAGPSRKRKRSVTASGSSSESEGAEGSDLSSPSKTPPPPPSGTASRPRARPVRGRGSQGTTGS